MTGRVGASPGIQSGNRGLPDPLETNRNSCHSLEEADDKGKYETGMLWYSVSLIVNNEPRSNTVCDILDLHTRSRGLALELISTTPMK